MVEPEELAAHARFVRGLARDLVHDRALADDVAQEVLVAGLERPPRQRQGLVAWLRTSARRAAATLGRREQTRRRHELRSAAGATSSATIDVVAREELTRRVVDAVFSLEEPFKTTILLRYYEGLPPRSIAARVGAPVETVRTRIKRGLERVRARLDQSADRREWAAALGEMLSLESAATSSVAIGAILAALLLGSFGGWWLLRDGGSPRVTHESAVVAGTDGVAPLVVDAGVSREPAAADRANTAAPTPADPRTTVHGHVVDQSGHPIEGARVWVIENSGWLNPPNLPAIVRRLVVGGPAAVPEPGARSGRDGSFAIPDQKRFDTLLLAADADGFGVSARYARTAEAIELGLERALPLEGTVVEAGSGRPIAGAGVTLSLGGIDGGNALRWARVVTDANGVFRFAKADPSQRRNVILDRPGCLPCVVKTTVIGEDPATSVVAQWPATTTFECEVFDDETRLPIEGARVTGFDDRWYAYAAYEPDVAEDCVIAETDGAGRFRVEAGNGARQLVVVEADDYVARVVDVADVGRAASGLRPIPLRRGASLDGVVLDPDGRPLPGAGVLVTTREIRDVAKSGRSRELPSALHGTSSVSWSRSRRCITDSRGRFCSSGLFDEESWTEGHDRFIASVGASHCVHGKGDLEPLELSFGEHRSGLVVRMRGKPVLTVTGRVLVEGTPARAIVSITVAGAADPRCKTDEFGEFRFEYDQRPQRLELTAIPAELEYGAEDSARVVKSVEPGDADSIHVDLELPVHRGTISGVVRCVDGQPVRHAEIQCLQFAGPGAHSFAYTRTDDQGRYSLSVIDALGDQFDVSVQHGGYGETHKARLGSTDVDFTVPKLGVVRLIVRNKITQAAVFWPSISVRHQGRSEFQAVNSGRSQIPEIDGGIELALPLGVVALKICESSLPVTLDPVVVGETTPEPILVELQPLTTVFLHVRCEERTSSSPHLLLLLTDDEKGRVHGGPNATGGCDLQLDGHHGGELEGLLSRTQMFAGTDSVLRLEASPGHYRISALPDDLDFEPAELDVGTESNKTIDVTPRPRAQ
jgi:RNA polymerase sigma-70 factor (ECF subfamily)